MRIIETDLPNLLLLEPRVFADDRGYFMENYNKARYAEAGISCEFVQDNESCSEHGVIRGLHYQLNPHSQAKLIRVVHGKILDVVLDLRQGSPSYGKYYSVELSDDNKRLLFIPKGFAHGFSVLSPKAIVQYKCDALYNPDSERGVRFDDPTLAIDWLVPMDGAIISPKDLKHPNLADAETNFTFKNEMCNG